MFNKGLLQPLNYDKNHKVFFRWGGNKIILTKTGNPRSCPHKVLFCCVRSQEKCFCFAEVAVKKSLTVESNEYLFPIRVPIFTFYESAPPPPPMATALRCMSLVLELHVMYVCESGLVSVWVLCGVFWSGLCMSFVLSGMVWFACCCVARYGEVKVDIHYINFQGRQTSPARKVYERGDIHPDRSQSQVCKFLYM